MAVNGYKYTDLNQEQLEKIKNIEAEINQDSNDEVILLAFNRD
ncbi:hypothetical protein [Natroniella acetigena]|nr:hypothetical protein [Natroniella acetigena]